MRDEQTRSNQFRGLDFSQECRNHNLTSVPLASSPADDELRADWYPCLQNGYGVDQFAIPVYAWL
jgi:hypothetical protein